MLECLLLHYPLKLSTSDFTRGAADEEAVHAAVDEEVDDLVEGLEVDLAVLEGRDDRGDDAGEAGVHVAYSLL